MRKILKFILFPKALFVLIFLLFVVGLLLKGRFEFIRFSEYPYLHKYAKHIYRVFLYLSVGLSFLYPLIIWFKKRDDFKKHLLWTIIAFIPAIWFSILLVLSN